MKKKLSLTTKIFIGLIVGFITGLIVNQMPESYLRDTLLIKGIFQLVGQVFLRSIMMLVVPLVFITIVNGVLNMGDVKRLGRIGGKTLVFYMCTTAIAIIIVPAVMRQRFLISFISVIMAHRKGCLLAVAVASTESIYMRRCVKPILYLKE